MRGNRMMPLIVAFILTQLCTLSIVQAQTANNDQIIMEVGESYINEHIISHIIKIKNRSELEFKGTLKFDSESEINTLSKNDREVNLLPGDSSFFAFRLVISKNLSAGIKPLRYTLYNEEDNSVLVKEMNYKVEVRENINLITDDTPLMVINPEDSVRINVTVNNIGNLTEEVTLVFNIPEIRGIPQFTELKLRVEPMSRKTQTFSFIVSSNLLIKPQFPVYISAMKGRDKKLFGSRNLIVQNVSSNKSFGDINAIQDIMLSRGASDNSLSLSYSQYNRYSSMLQLQGGKMFNLPAGYIHLKGNLYKYGSSDVPVSTGTSLTYKLNDNEFIVGNVSEYMELPMYGRGAKMKFSDGNDGVSFTVGAIDQNYNLFSDRTWFSDYYSFYAKAELGANSHSNGVQLSYLYQSNIYESANFHVSSLKWRSDIGEKWNIDMSAHGAMGLYEITETPKFTGAAEIKYRGAISDLVTLNGSAYYSDPYFPGSRKGTVNFNQGFGLKIINDINLSGNIGYNKTEPKSYANNYNYSSEYSNANIFLSLPSLKKLSGSLYYRLQGESSTSYSQSIDNDDSLRPLGMSSNRLGLQLRWQGSKTKHSILGTFEAGVFKDPLSENIRNQAKSTLNYSYDWLNMNISYQRGAYYLYEHLLSSRQNKDFYRFSSSISANKEISKKLIFSSGINFTRDNYQGNVPSVNMSVNWMAKDNFAIFMNSYWYRYEFVSKVNTYNIQAGVTYTFRSFQQNSGKKSRLIAQVYYDRNANNKYDDGDEPANDYLISLNKKVFITDKLGRIRYSNVPFGEVNLKSYSDKSWTFEEKNIEINKFKTKVNIPLKQSGTLQGSVKYLKGEFSMSTSQKLEGLRFTISNSDNSINRTVVSDSNGNILTFLPNGVYTIQLSKNSLPEHTDSVNPQQIFQIEAGKVTMLDDFEIIVKERKINIKRF
ncbi:MAG: carboxypeptidase-like regulatory domain-containing protein [Bacteroidales bacterium]